MAFHWQGWAPQVNEEPMEVNTPATGMTWHYTTAPWMHL